MDITRGYMLNIGEEAIGVERRNLTGDTEEGVHTEGWNILRNCQITQTGAQRIVQNEPRRATLQPSRYIPTSI